MTERTETTRIEPKTYTNADEVYIVMRNKDTGKCAYVLLTGVDQHSLGFEMEVVYPDPLEFYGGLMTVQPNAEVKNTTVHFSARGLHRGVAADMEKFSVDQMRKVLNGDKS